MSTTTLFTSDSVIGAKFGILQADAGVIEQTTLTDTQPALSVIGKGNSASNALLDIKKGSTQHFNISDVGSLVSSTENTGSISLQAGSGGINMDCTQSTGNLTVDTAGGEIQIGVNAAAGAIKLGTNTTARTITIGSGANTTLDINSAATTIDSTALSIDSTDTTNLTMTANANGAKVMTIAATNGGSGEGQMAISATDQLTITQNAAVITMDGNAITAETTGTIGIGTTSAAGNINIGTEATARTMTIGASTTTLDIDGAGITIDGSTLSIDSTDTTNLTMTANSAAAKTLLIKSLNSGSGEGKISINSDSQVDITDGTATLTLDGGALSETSLASADITPSGTLTLQGGGVSKFGDDTGYIQFNGSGAVSTTGMTNVDLDASGTIGINSSAGVISIGNDAVNQAINIATGGTRTVTLGASTTTLDINTAGATIDSTTLSVDSTDTTNLTMTANAASTKTMTIQALNSNGSNISELKLVSDGDMKLIPGSAAGSTGATKTLIIDSTAAIKVPVGTSAQRPSAAQGQIRFNTTTGGYEGYTGSTWGSLGGVVDSAHDSNTFLIAGKVSSASVTVVDTMVSSGQVGTDDTLSFFAGTTAGDKKGFRKMTMDKDNLIVYDKSDSTTNIFKVENTGNTTIAGTLGVNGNTISSTVTGAFNLLNTNVTTLNLGGAVTTATIAAAGTAITMGAASAGQVQIRNTSDSTSATTGALRVDGGVGIAKDLYVGGGKIEIGSEGSKSIVKMADDAEIQDAGGHGRIKFTNTGGVILTDNAGSTELTVADGQVTIAGNLTVSGTTTIVNSTTIEVGDSMLKLAKGNDSSDAADFGIYGLYTSGGAKYAGIYRDATDSTFKLFKDLTAEPGATVTAFGSSGAARANLEIADLVMGKASASTITHTGTNGNAALGLTISSTNGHVTVEGIKFLGSNLITTGGLDLDISGGSGLDIDITGAFTIDSSSGSNINVTGANLDLKTTTSGDININSAADLDLDSVTLNVNSSGAMAITSASTLAITNTSSTTTMNFAGQTLDIDAATVTIDTSANASITAGGTLGLTATSGKTSVNCGSQELEIDSGVLKIDSKDTTNLTMTANAAGAKVMTISATNSGSGEGQIAITSDSQVSITDGTATLKLDGGAVTAETTGTIEIGATSAAGAINIGTNNTARTTTIGAITTTLDINSLSTTLDSNTTLSIDSKDTTNLTMSADNASDKTLTIAASNANVSGDGLIAINADGISGTAIKDEDNMASNSATHLASQQSIKAYVDTVTNTLPTNAKLTTPWVTDSGSNHYYKFVVSDLAADRTITLPLLGGNDTFVFEAHTQTLSNKTLTEPKIANGGFIADANGNELMVFNTTASAVNFLDLTNAAANGAVALAAKGTDANISLTIASKGTGTINVLGTTALKVPVGTTAQRPSAATGQIRFNSTTGGYEGYTGTTWGSLGGIVDSAHGSNTFLIAGKVADASVFGSTAAAFNASNKIGTDDTLSFFAGSVDGESNAERGARKMIISKDNITMFSKTNSTSVIFDVNNSGNTIVAGTLAVNGATLSTDDTTFNLVNTNATTVNFAGAATTVNIGTGAGTVNINTTTNSTSSTTGALVVDGGLGIASNFVMGGTSFTMGNGATIVNTDGNTLTVTEATLAVVGNQTLSGNLTIATNKFSVASATGNTVVAGTLAVTGATGIDGDFDINTNKFTVASATGNTAVAGTLGVTGATTLSSTLGVTSTTTLGSTLDVSGNTTINNGNFSIKDGSSNETFGVTAASGNTAISGTLSATGDFKVNTNKFVVTATNGNTSVAGTLGVTGATTLNNALTVSGANATLLGGTLGVSGATTLNNANFTIKDGSAATKFAVTAASGNTDVKGTLDSAGDFKVATNKFTVASATGNTVVAGTLAVTGATGIDGDFDIATSKFTVASATGNTVVAGTMGVTGATTLTSTLAVNGGTISTDDTTFNLLNATAETVNFAGAGTSIVMGAASAGQVQIKNTSDSTSATTGALRVDGGVGIAKDLFVGGGKIQIAAGVGTKSIVKMADTAEIQDASGHARIKFTDTGNIILNNPTGGPAAGELTVSDAGVVITGNLTVSGTTTTVNSTTVSVADAMIKLAKNQANTTDTVDFGVYGQFGDGGTHKFAGLYRDASDGVFKLFKGLTTEPADTTTAFGTDGSTRASLELANIVMGDTGNNTITHTGGGATGLTISSTNGHVTVEGVKFTGSTLASTGGLDLDISGGSGLDIDVTGAVNIDASSGSTINVTGANLDLKTTTGGDININSVADLDLDGATVNVNSSASMAITAGSTLGITATSGATTLNCAGQTLNVDSKLLQIDSTDTTNLTMTAADANDKTITIAASNGGDGDGLIAINADGISGTAIKDEDNMASNSATHLATQQSIKAYVDDKTTSIPANALLTTPRIKELTNSHYYQFASSELAANRTITLPLLTGNDTFVFEAHTQTLSNKTLTAPKFANGGFIADANGAEMMVFNTTASAVNFLDLTNSTTGNAIDLAAKGDDANISFKLTPKGTGTLDVISTTAIKVPVGTSAQRPSAAQGQIRYNTTTSTYEGYTGATWGSLGGVIDSAHDSNTFVIAGKVSSASVTVVDGMVSSEEVGTDDTLSFFAGVATGDKKGFRKMTIDKDDLKFYTKADSTTVKFSINDSGNTAIAGTLGVTGAATLSSTLSLSGDATFNDADLTIKDGSTNTKFSVLSASGNTDVKGTLDAAGDFKINTNKFTVTAASGNTAIAGTLDATGDFKINTNKFTVAAGTGNTVASGTLTVSGTGSSSIAGALTVGGNTIIDNASFTLRDGTPTNKFTIDTSGNTAISGTLGVTGAATLSSTLAVTGATGIDGDFDIATNKFTVASASGNTAIAGTLGVTGATTLDSTLSIGGATTINNGNFIIKDGSTPANNKFTVTAASGNTDVKGTLDAAGDFKVATNKFTVAAASGNTVAAGTLYATGDFKIATDKFTVASASGNSIAAGTFKSTGNLTVGASGSEKLTVVAASGNTTIGGTLGVTGVSTLTGIINADGGIAVDTNKFTVADTSGNVSTAGTLTVTGISTLNGNVSVSGTNTFTVGTGVSALGGNLTVAGTSTLSGNVSVAGTNTFTVGTGLTTLGGNLNLTGTADVGSTFRVNTNKFTVASDTGNTVVAGTLNATGNFNINTDKFQVVAASGNTTVAGTLGVTGITTMSSALDLNSTADISDTLTLSKGSGTGLSVTSDATIGGTLGVTGLSTLTAGAKIPDNQTLTLGSDDDITIKYDEATNDSIEFAANVEGQGLGIVFKADQGDDAGDTWKLNFADGGVVSLGNDINTKGTFVSQLTLTPNSTVANSTTAIVGKATIGGTLGVTGITTMSAALDLNSTADISDTLTLSKASGTGLSVTSNATVGGTLDTTGNFNVNTNKFSVIAASGNTTVAGTLGVTGITTMSAALDLNSTADISGTLTLSKASGTGLSVTSDATVGGTLGITGITTMSAALDLNSTADISGTLTLSKGSGTGLSVTSDATVGGTLGVTGLSTLTAGAKIPDNQTLTLGSDDDITIKYDEATNDSIEFAANVEGKGLGMVFKADQGDDAGDTWKLNFADGGVVSLGNDINTKGTFVSQLTLTPNSTVANSTTAIVGKATIGGTLGVTGITTMSAALDLNSTADISDTLTLSKASGTGLSVTSNATVGGTLGVTGAATLSNTLGVTGATTLSTLDVTGATGIDGDFDIATNKFTVASASGNTVVAGTLAVNGATLSTDDATFSLINTTATTVNFAGAGTSIIMGAASAGQVQIRNTTDSTSATTGALRVDGGVGIAKDLYVGGGQIEIAAGAGTKSIIKMADTAELQDASGNARITFTDAGNVVINDNAGGTELTVANGSVTIAGDLIVSGTTTTVNSTTVAIADSMLKVAKDNSANAIDFGIYGQFNDGSAKFSGLYRDATDGYFKLFTSLTTEPTTTVSAYGTNNAARANLEVGNLLLGSTDNASITHTSASTKVLSFVSTNGIITLNGAEGINLNGNASEIDITTSGAVDINSGAFTVDGSTVTIKGTGASKYGDDTATLDFDGSGAVSETGMTSFSITPSGGITLTGGAASSLTTSAGALTLTGSGGVTLGSDTSVSGTLGVTGITTMSAALDLNSTANISDTLTLSKGSGTGLNVSSNAIIGGTLGVTGLSTLTAGAKIPDNQTLTLGSDDDITIKYDEATNDSIEFAANVEGKDLGMVFKADQGDDAGDTWKLNFADGGVVSLGNDINTKGTFVSQLTLTPNATVANSTTAIVGKATVGGTLGVTGASTLNTLDVTGATGIDGDFDIATSKFTVASASGNTVVAGTLAVNGASITTDDTSFSLINTTATTVNFAGAGTTINIGAASGSGKVNIKATTDSTSATTGALVVDGGIGIAKDIFIGGNTITLGHGAIIENTNANLLTITEAKVAIAGAQDISGDLDVNSKFIVTASNGNTSVGGNLTVTGTLNVTGTQSVTSMAITGSTVEIGSDSSDNNEDRGVEYKWHNGSAAKLGFFGMDDSSGQFVYIPDATQGTSNVFTGTVGSAQFSGITAPGLMTLNGTNGMKLQENGTDILDITDAAAVTFSSGTGQALNITAKAASIFKSSSGNLTMQSEAANLILDGKTGVQIDASTSGTVEINAAAGKILLGNDNVAQNIEIGNIGAARTIIVGHASSTEVELNGDLLDFNAGASGLTMDTSGQITMTTTATNANSMVVTSGGGIDITATGAVGKDIDVTCTSGSVNFSAGEAVIDAMKFTTSAGSSGMTFSSGSLGTEFTGTGGSIYGSTSSSDTTNLIAVIPSSTASGVAKDSSNNVITSNGRALPCFSVDNAGNFNIGYDHVDATTAVKKKCALVLKSTSTIDTSDSDQNSARFNALSQHNKAALRIAGDVTITGKIYCPNALASSSSVRFNTEIITLSGEFEYSSGTNSGAWVPKIGSEPTFSTSGDLSFTPNNGQGSSPTTNAEGTNNKATDGWSSALVAIGSANGNNQTTYNKCTSVNGMNRVNMILIRNKIRCPTNGSNVFDARAANAPKMRLFIDDLTSSDDGYVSMNGTQLCIFYEEYNASDGTNSTNDPIANSGVSVRPPLLEIYFSKYKSNANNATNTYYRMVGGGVTTRTGFPGLPYAHGIVFSSGGQNIQAVAVGGKVRVTGGTGAYAFLQQQSTDGGGSSDTTGAALYSQNATNNVFYT